MDYIKMTTSCLFGIVIGLLIFSYEFVNHRNQTKWLNELSYKVQNQDVINFGQESFICVSVKYSFDE